MSKPIRVCITICLLLIAQVSLAQSVRLSGKVTNTKNEPLGGVTIKIQGTNTGTITDYEGRFILNLSIGQKYSLNVSTVGYQPKSVEEMEVRAGQFNELNIVMEVKEKVSEGVTITSKGSTARKETVNALITFQRSASTVASVIAAETIRRSPDRNTGEVLKRIPGASIQEGKFIVIRGLADRYNQAMLNGILLTSTEPDRKTFSFDLIPANMIDNLIINKAFVPEYPGEWAGGLIQVNTKDIPSTNSFNIQVGTGMNSQTMGQPFYIDPGGKLDWLGIDDGTRALPAGYTRKAEFDTSSAATKTAIGKQMRNAWAPIEISAPMNVSFQSSGSFSSNVFGKKLGGIIGLTYNRSNRRVLLLNRSNAINGNQVSINYNFEDTRYQREVSAGAIGSLALQLNNRNRITLKSLVNVNTSGSVTRRNGADYNRDEEIRGTEMSFKENTFFTTQLQGDHTLTSALKFHWYGAFNILDGYIPDQRRIAYVRNSGGSDPYKLLISNSLSQQSGSRIYQNLSDYIYTTGGDLSYGFDWLGQKQTLKGGYMLQIKDRLYDAKLFGNYLTVDNPGLRLLPADRVFDPANFGNGTDNLFGFDAIKGKTFRYMANTILNGGFLQLDNQFTKNLRVVWGLRVEHYDQLVGSVKTWDPRHTRSKVLDFLPGLNATWKATAKTNLRFSASQTVIRPELRELAYLNLYDFELNASVQGNPFLLRTKIANLDLRYELYPRAGEIFTFGAFYKKFDNPIEQLFNEGAGGASTFSYQNAKRATAFGIEAEFRKKLDFSDALKNFTFQANGSLIKSQVKDAKLGIDRTLQGQSPYMINLGLLYDLEKSGLTATLLYNRIGERIYLVGDISAGSGSPDILEAPRHLLDLQLSKKILKKKGEFRFNVADLLNATQYFYQNTNGKTTFQKESDAYRFTRRPGTNFSLTFNYNL
ncbi:MAG: TonB-dependent receptor domain-containing protein [Bacteroidota bacterium]